MQNEPSGLPDLVHKAVDALMELYISSPKFPKVDENLRYSKALENAYTVLDEWGMIGE